MTAIFLKCIKCGKEFWSNGFDHVCYECSCQEPSEAYEERDINNYEKRKSNESKD